MSLSPQRLVFVVGVPRSGTTLLRELITQHSCIAMPRDEFQILPFFLKRYAKDHKITASEKKEILNILRRSPFYFHLKSDKTLEHLQLSDTSIEGILIEMLKYFSPEQTGYNSEWVGEKTPNNLLDIFNIADRFERSKFIHVVRDPRDVAVSMKKAWGKSYIRSVLAWEKAVNLALDFEVNFPERILHVKYEELVQRPEKELTRISNFLAIKHEAATCQLVSSREQMGDAAGIKGIKKNNSDKFYEKMIVDDIEKIDGYLSGLLDRFSYSRSKSDKTLYVVRWRLKIIALVDFCKSFRWHIKNKGFLKGISYRIKQALLG